MFMFDYGFIHICASAIETQLLKNDKCRHEVHCSLFLDHQDFQHY